MTVSLSINANGHFFHFQVFSNFLFPIVNTNRAISVEFAKLCIPLSCCNFSARYSWKTSIFFFEKCRCKN